jgi:hypothetical protein
MVEARAQRRRAAPTRMRSSAANRTKIAVELSEDLLESVEDAQRAAIEALHKFVDSVDRVLPALPHGEGPSRRQLIIDSALEMTDRLVHVQYDFICKVLDSAGDAVDSR